MNPPPDVLVMDLGGVTCRWLPDRRLTALSELCGLPAETIDQLVFVSGFDDAGERGRFSRDEFVGELLSGFGVGPGRWRARRPGAELVVRAVPGCAAHQQRPRWKRRSSKTTEVGNAFSQFLFSWRLAPPSPTRRRSTGRTSRIPAPSSSTTARPTSMRRWRPAGGPPLHNSLNLQAALTDVGLL